MALRVGGVPFAPPTPLEAQMTPAPELQEEMMAEEPMAEEPMEEMPSARELGKATMEVAGYKGPEMGPFNCGSCEFWREDGSCILVAGPIQAEGLCNLFTPQSAGAQDMEMEMPMEGEGAEEAPLPAEDNPPPDESY